MRLLLLHIALFLSTALWGATCTTTSTTTWDCGTPGSNDDLIVNHSITINSDFTVNTGSITVNSPNTLTINGNLTFNNNSTVLVNQGACISVLGNFLNKNNSGDVQILGTLVVTGNFANGEGSGNGAEITVGGTGSITIGGMCSNPGTVGDDTDTFTGCNNAILPVELVNFRGTATESGNLLQWETASERNNDHFQVQRSLDGMNWEEIGRVQGGGDSNQFLSYDFLDANPIPGRNFYRLKQVDYDGAFEFSYIISVVTGQIPQLQVQSVFPNPSKGLFTISYLTNNQYPLNYSVYDGSGRVISSGSFSNSFGSNQVELDLSGIPQGMYILRLSNQDLFLQEKIVRLP